MENTETPVQAEESTPVVEPVIDSTLNTNGEPSVIENTSTTNGEHPVTETTTAEVVPVTESEVVPPPPTTEEGVEEVTKPLDEQENVTGTNTTVPPTCLSPGRTNVPLKEVNESEKEEAAVLPNGTENPISKKRELEQEDEPTEETTNDNEDRVVGSGDQSKKLKTTEVIDTPVIETKESENNHLVNGNTAVEV